MELASRDAAPSARPPVWAAPSLALLFGMIFLPTALQPVKAALLLVAVAVVVGAELVRRERTVSPRGARRTLHRSTALWTVALCALGLAFMARGLLRGEPGALRVGTVYVLWPAALVALAAGAADRRVIRAHVALLVLGAFAASLYGIEFVLEQGGTLPRSIFPDLFEDQGVGFYDGFVELRLPPLAVLPFALPFLVAAAVCWGGGHGVLRRRWVWPALLAALFLALVSGRRAVQLVAALAPFLTLAFAALLPSPDRRALRRPLLGLLAVLMLGAFFSAAFLAESYGFDVEVVMDEFRQGFDPTSSESSSIRAVQFDELIKGWERNPFFGGGHGAFLRDHIRDPQRPWSYELSYPTLLFQTGVVGTLAYGALFGWLLWHAVRMIREGGETGRAMLPIAVGLVCFLIANATNPYLLKFDFMWTVFLPLAMVNRWLVEREEAVRA